MNKMIPDQKELLRDTLHVESPAQKEVSPPIIGSGIAFDDGDEFDWSQDDAVIIPEQRATAAYRNRMGELVIRQRGAWDDDGDAFVYISPGNEIAFMEGLAKRAKEGVA